jgi:predicted membrane-bound spermidine synthase
MSLMLCAIMFVSGAAALIFETLWFRQAGLAFGNSVWASSLVLASFMAGLALGNGCVARFGARIRRPVRFYAWLELAIAAWGIAVVWILPHLAGWLAPLWRSLLESPWLLNLVRLLLAFLLLLIPATAMGATLPVLVKALRVRDPNFGSVLGRLYGWNTLGAVAGALAAEVVLVEPLGIRGCAFAAGALNLSAALAAAGLSLRGGAHGHPASPAAPRAAALPAAAWRLLAAAFLSGTILLALEVVWFRFIDLFVWSRSLSFSLMLAVVLAGIGLGGQLAGALLRRRADGYGIATPAAFVSGALAVATYAGFSAAVAPYGSQSITRARDVLWLSAALMLPVSLLSGALFTWIGTALHREVQPDTRATGLLTLANTVGAGLGALAGGFLLLPLLGIERSFFWLAAAYGAVGLLLLGTGVRAAGWARRGLRCVGPLLLLASLLLFPFGAMRDDYVQTIASRFGYPARMQIAATRETPSESILYLRSERDGEPLHYLLVTNGFGMAGTRIWSRRYMKQFVYWPVALHPQLRRTLLISYGSGATAQALAHTPGLDRIDVVDISRGILELSDIVYPKADEHPLRDPRVRVHVEDGRFFLLTRDERYDLITSEPPPPKHAGVVNLYTREFFRLVYARLAEGGINTHWLPTHGLTLADTRAIVRGYCEVFTDCSLWTGLGLNWMLAGSRNARWSRSQDAFSRQWQDPRAARELRGLAFERPEQMGATFIADAQQLRALFAETPPLVDDFPKRVSDHGPTPEDREAHLEWMDAQASRERFRASGFISAAWPEALRARTIEHFDHQHTLHKILRDEYGRPIRLDLSIETLHELLVKTDLETLPLWLLGADHDLLRLANERLAARRAPAFAYAVAGANALAQRRFDRAVQYYAMAARGSARDDSTLFLRAYALSLSGRLSEAREVARRRPADAAAHGHWTWLRDTFDLDESP